MSSLSCSDNSCQGKTYLGSAQANASGVWVFKEKLGFGQIFTALAKNTFQTSDFATCFQLCPATFSASIQPELSSCGEGVALKAELNYSEGAEYLFRD